MSGEDAATLERVAAAYGAIVDAGVHRAPSIKVAEAAKVIENTQRDLNIALMNELAIIFDRMGIRTADVLAAAGTKWNFLRFRPGLVGGHCIGVDPYYLTTKAQQLGYQPEVILAGRRINNNMGAVRRAAPREAPHRRRHHGEEGAGRRPRPHVQGGLQRPPQQQGARHPARSSDSSASTPMVHDPLASAAEAHARVRAEARAARGDVRVSTRWSSRSATSGTSSWVRPRILGDDPRRRRPRRREERARSGRRWNAESATGASERAARPVRAMTSAAFECLRRVLPPPRSCPSPEKGVLPTPRGQVRRVAAHHARHRGLHGAQGGPEIRPGGRRLRARPLVDRRPSTSLTLS